MDASATAFKTLDGLLYIKFCNLATAVKPILTWMLDWPSTRSLFVEHTFFNQHETLNMIPVNWNSAEKRLQVVSVLYLICMYSIVGACPTYFIKFTIFSLML